jgi:hypothetical protein
MKMSSLLALSLVALLGACSQNKQPPPPAAAVPPAATPPGKTVFDTQLRALQKAKDVQKTVDQQKADLDKKLDDQGG